MVSVVEFNKTWTIKMGLVALVGIVKGTVMLVFVVLALFCAPKVIGQVTAVLVGVLVLVLVAVLVEVLVDVSVEVWVDV